MNALTLELIALHAGSAVVILGVVGLFIGLYLACEDLWGWGMSTTKRISENDTAPYFGWTKPILLKECCELTNAAHNLKKQRDELSAKVIDLESEIEDRDKRTDIDYHRNSAIRELLYLCDEEIAQLPIGEEFGIEHLARAVNKLKYVELPDYKQQRDELLAALKEAVDCEMVPTSSARDGGANRHVKQLHVADRIRDAIKNAEGK